MNFEIDQFDHELHGLLNKLETKPNDLALIARLCYELNIRSFHDECIKLAQEGMQIDSKAHDIVFEFIVASSLNSFHQLDQLAREFKKRDKDGKVSRKFRRNHALVLFYLEEDEQALRILDELVDKKGKKKADSRTYEVLALIHFAREDYGACINACDHAVDARGPSARAVRLKGLSFLELGDIKKAKACLTLALRYEPNFVWACHSLGELYLEQADLTLALRYFGKATYINPPDPGNYFLLAEAFIDMERYNLAQAEIEKLLLMNPSGRIEAEAYNTLGYLLMQKGELDEARVYLTRAVEIEPELSIAYYNMGRLAYHQGHLTQAERRFKKALSFDPKHVASLIELGYLELAKSKYEQANQKFRMALDVAPHESEAYIGLASMAHKTKDHANQLIYAERAYEYDAENPDVCNQLGIAYECKQMWKKAARAYERALELDPFHSQAANNLGYLYEKRINEEPGRAEFLKQKAIEAWSTRYKICSALKKSVKGATNHLEGLGLSRQTIRELAKEDYPSS